MLLKYHLVQIQAENVIAAGKKEVNKIKASIAITKSELRLVKRQSPSSNKTIKKMQIARQLVKLNSKLGQQVSLSLINLRI